MSDKGTGDGGFARGLKVPDNAGVFYIASGVAFAQETEQSIACLRQHSDIPIHVMTSHPEEITDRAGLTVETIEHEKGLWVKPKYMDASPFELTLFLDSDAMVVHPDALLPFKIIEPDIYDLAWCHAPKRGFNHMRGIVNCVASWNSGVMFFDMRSQRTKDILVAYRKRYAPNKNDTRMSDQAILSQLVWKHNFPSYTLCPEWNCRGHISGCIEGPKVRIVHNRRAVRQFKQRGEVVVRDYLAGKRRV